MANALESLFAHPVAIAAHVFSQALGTGPVFHHVLLLFAVRQRANWRLACEFGRDFDHGFVDHHRDRVQVAGVTFQPQALGFQRNGTTTGKGIMEGG